MLTWGTLQEMFSRTREFKYFCAMIFLTTFVVHVCFIFDDDDPDLTPTLDKVCPSNHLGIGCLDGAFCGVVIRRIETTLRPL